MWTFLEKVRPDIIHQFDVWHVRKSMKKKLSRKLRQCEKLAKWSKSIINHFWRCCRTCEGNQKLLKEKWVSLLFHIRNRHTWETEKNFTLFNRCAHPPLSLHQEEGVEWLEANSPGFQALEVIVLDKGLLKDPHKLTEFCHTGPIEVFLSLINKYSPKRQHFLAASQYARHQLSVMDHNSGTERDYKRNSSGDVVTKIQYSKSSKCWVSKPVRKKKEKKYLHEMMEKLLKLMPKILLWTHPISQILQQILHRILVQKT